MTLDNVNWPSNGIVNESRMEAEAWIRKVVVTCKHAYFKVAYIIIMAEPQFVQLLFIHVSFEGLSRFEVMFQKTKKLKCKDITDLKDLTFIISHWFRYQK